MADGARGGRQGRAERRALRHVQQHENMAKAGYTGSTGSMNGAPHVPSGMEDVPGAGLESQWRAPPAVAYADNAGKATDHGAGEEYSLDDSQAVSPDEPDDAAPGPPGSPGEHDHSGCTACGVQKSAPAVGDGGNLARGATTHSLSHPVMSMPGSQDQPATASYQKLDLHPRPGAPDKTETIRQDIPANFSGGTVTVESRDLKPPAAGTPSHLGFDHDPAVGPGQGAATHGATHGLMPCKPTGPATAAVGIKFTVPAPGESR